MNVLSAGIKQFATLSEQDSFESKANQTINQKILNISQYIDQQENLIIEKANDSISDLTQAAWKQSTSLDVDIALLKHDAAKVDYLIETAHKLQQNVENIMVTLQNFARRVNGELVQDQLQV